MFTLTHILAVFVGCIVLVGATALSPSLHQRMGGDLRMLQSQPLRLKKWYDWNDDDTRLSKRWYDWQALPLSDNIDLMKKNRLNHMERYLLPGNDWLLG